MSPDQFLKLTTSRTGRLAVSSQTGPMDAEKLIEATRQQPLQLIISGGEVVGHEGRHRATALSRADVRSIPVLVFDSSNKYSKTDVPEMVLQGQDFGSSRSNDRVNLENLTPLSYENREKIIRDYGAQDAFERSAEKLGYRQTMRFSRETDAAYLAAVKAGDMDTAQRMVDEAAKRAGYTVKAYHGTPNGTYTVFRDWSYFTEDKDYADVYQNQGASSNRYKKTADNPKTYSVYLDPRNVFDPRTPRDRRIFKNEFYQKWGNGTPLSERGLPDWTDGDDLIEFFDENGYDYDAFYLDEGGTGGHGEEVKDRGVSIIVKDSAQIKSADPVTYDDNGKVIPLSQRFNPEKDDIRWSRETPGDTEALRAAIRSRKLSFSEQGNIPDYNQWRKANFGRLTVSKDGVPVETRWQELQILVRKTGPGDGGLSSVARSDIQGSCLFLSLRRVRRQDLSVGTGPDALFYPTKPGSAPTGGSICFSNRNIPSDPSPVS